MFDKLKTLQYGLKVKWYEKTQRHMRTIDGIDRQDLSRRLSP